MPITLDGTNGITTPMYGGNIAANAVTPSVNMKNRIINGAMVIDQRNAGASVTPTVGGVYPVDRFRVREDTDGTATVQRSTVVPTGQGFINSIVYTVTGTDSSLSASQFVDIAQIIEGLNMYDFGWGSASAKTITISFWVRSSVTGTYVVCPSNSAYNRSYPATYTINSADTWEYKTITIAGDTSGTWLTDNGVGMYLSFALACGTNNQGTANTWNAAGTISTSSAVNLMATNGATFYLTGVQLEVGSTATSFDYRPYGTELALAQRYYYRYVMSTQGYSNFGIGYATGSTNAYIQIKNPVPMRAIPSGVDFSALSTYSYGVNPTPSALTTNALGIDITVLQLTGTGMVAFQAIPLFGNNNTGAYIGVTAEL
jgi:hypothetical protein